MLSIKQLFAGDIQGLEALVEETTGRTMTKRQLQGLFEQLPENCQSVAMRHGFNDTAFQKQARSHFISE